MTPTTPKAKRLARICRKHGGRFKMVYKDQLVISSCTLPRRRSFFEGGRR